MTLPRHFGLAWVLGAGMATLIVSTTIHAQNRDTQIEQTEKQLAEVRQRIQALRSVQQDLASKQRQELNALREADQQVADVSKKEVLLSKDMARTTKAMDRLAAQEARLSASLGDEKAALAQLLRLTYQQNRDHRLKLIFAQDEISQIARVMTYQKHLLGHQKTQIDGLMKKMAALLRLVQEQQKLAQTLNTQKTALDEKKSQPTKPHAGTSASGEAA